MARENRLWTWMREGWKGIEGLHVRRVENLAGDGDPDVDGCYRGIYFEVELKGCDRPKNPLTPLAFEVRQSQVVWHKRRGRAGGNNWIYVRVGQGQDVARYLVPGNLAPLMRAGLTEGQLALASVMHPEHGPTELLDRLCAGVRG